MEACEEKMADILKDDVQIYVINLITTAFKSINNEDKTSADNREPDRVNTGIRRSDPYEIA